MLSDRAIVGSRSRAGTSGDRSRTADARSTLGRKLDKHHDFVLGVLSDGKWHTWEALVPQDADLNRDPSMTLALVHGLIAKGYRIESDRDRFRDTYRLRSA